MKYSLLNIVYVALLLMKGQVAHCENAAEFLPSPESGCYVLLNVKKEVKPTILVYIDENRKILATFHRNEKNENELNSISGEIKLKNTYTAVESQVNLATSLPAPQEREEFLGLKVQQEQLVFETLWTSIEDKVYSAHIILGILGELKKVSEENRPILLPEVKVLLNDGTEPDFKGSGVLSSECLK
jgi:hypothetical protein